MLTTEKIRLDLDPSSISIEQLYDFLDQRLGRLTPIINDLLDMKIMEEIVKEIPENCRNIKFKFSTFERIIVDLVGDRKPDSKNYYQFVVENFDIIKKEVIEYCRIVHEDEIIRFIYKSTLWSRVPIRDKNRGFQNLVTTN